MDTSLTEHTLGQARSQDPEALRRVYDALAPGVLAYLTAKGCDDPEALTQDVLLTLFTKLPELKGGIQGVRTFAYSVAHARMVDDIRRRQRQPVSAPYDPDTDRRSTASAEDNLMGAAAAVTLLEGLPDPQREVLLLRILADQSVEETAKIMGRTSGSVKTLQRRALLALREQLTRKEAVE